MFNFSTVSVAFIVMLIGLFVLRYVAIQRAVSATRGQARWLYWPDIDTLTFNPRYWAIWSKAQWLRWIDARHTAARHATSN